MNRSTSLARAIALMVVAAAPHASADERKPRRVDADSLATQAANQTIDAGLSSLRDSGVPFLGALQGGITYDHGTGVVRYDVLTIGELFGGDGPHHVLGQIGGHNHGDRDTLNAGLLWRWLDTDATWLVGGNLFFDRDFDTGAQRASVGVEAATPHWRLFANYYAPLSNAWHAALRDGDNFEERVARGIDLGASWSPVRIPSLDLQLKASRWYGDNVELFDDGRTLADPTVWTTRLGWTPVPLFAFAIAHDRAGNGIQDTRLELQLTHRFGRSLREQLEPTTVAHREALATRLLTPVERERRIVVERRESHQPLQIAGAAALRLTLRNDEVLSHAIAVSGGAGAIVLALEGKDAGFFKINGNRLEVAPAPATMQSEPMGHASGLPAGRDYAVTIVARDARGGRAQQRVEIALQAGGAPTMTTPTIEGLVAIGETLTGMPQGYADTDNDAPGAHRMQWYRTTDATGESRIAIESATQAQYTIVPADAGHRLVFEVTPVSTTGTPNEGNPVRAVSTPLDGSAPAMDPPSITGTLTVGSTLTATPQNYRDDDNDGPGAHQFRWYRATDAAGSGRTLIEGANSAQYTIDAADFGLHLVAEVAPVSATGTPNVGAPKSTVTQEAVIWVHTNNDVVPISYSATLTDIVVANRPGTASNAMRFKFNVEHPDPSKVKIFLMTPAGTYASLKNFDQPFPADGVFTFDGTGVPIEGIWRIEIRAKIDSVEGTLRGWSITP